MCVCIFLDKKQSRIGNQKTGVLVLPSLLINYLSMDESENLSLQKLKQLRKSKILLLSWFYCEDQIIYCNCIGPMGFYNNAIFNNNKTVMIITTTTTITINLLNKLSPYYKYNSGDLMQTLNQQNPNRLFFSLLYHGD